MIAPAAHHSIPDIALPNETLTVVFDELPPSTLATITRVSHRFNAVAERMLYASVLITDMLAEASPIPYKTLRWCESLLGRPHLLSATKRIHVRWHSDPQYPPPRHLTTPVVKLADVLGLLRYLESLDLFLGPANLAPTCLEPIHAIERIIRDCYFPMLRYCSLGAEWCKGVQPYTHVLGSFLASLTSLRHLKLQDHHSPLNIPSQALPFLTSFRGSPDTAAYLLPGRPVQYLSLLGQDSDVNRENLPRMTDTSVPLRYLDLSAMSARPILLRNISTHMPGIEVLKVRLALRHTLHYALSGINRGFSQDFHPS
ncbi:hypothetical protein BDN72DRAFT_850514 [Pluteus cervinus]|uniref:Uncharacterized protein n=1 Tax=Pluteus cervinus TaxID=181527 RepID=A0ACD3A462_9AGAR|nr:hypothetical protein BDN72DRAFT_850514 [Pluteus cervinus]